MPRRRFLGASVQICSSSLQCGHRNSNDVCSLLCVELGDGIFRAGPRETLDLNIAQDIVRLGSNLHDSRVRVGPVLVALFKQFFYLEVSHLKFAGVAAQSTRILSSEMGLTPHTRARCCHRQQPCIPDRRNTLGSIRRSITCGRNL